MDVFISFLGLFFSLFILVVFAILKVLRLFFFKP
jgi:hypothetical protein